MSLPWLYAYIDEAGQRSRTMKSSDHFVMSAAVIKAADLPAAGDLLAQLRRDLSRSPSDTLHWRNFKRHSQRVHAAKSMGGASSWLTLSSVVVCKRHLEAPLTMTDDMAYMYTFRYLLERLSWLARDSEHVLNYTLAHVVRFKLATLREYEANLRNQSPNQCKIAWRFVDPKGGSLDQPNRVECLQLGDMAASATFAAFEPDEFGSTESRYLRELVPALYRRGTGATALTSYGLKMHPWDDSTKAAYPWVTTL